MPFFCFVKEIKLNLWLKFAKFVVFVLFGFIFYKSRILGNYVKEIYAWFN